MVFDSYRGRAADGWHYGNLLHQVCKIRGNVTTDICKISPVIVNGPEWPVVVDPDTVSKSTGGYDRDHTEVFFGDILSIEFEIGQPESIATVVLDGFSCKIHERGYDMLDSLDSFILARSRVIGNVWDNPKLMEV